MRIYDFYDDGVTVRVRFDYRVLDEEGDPVVLVFEYSLDGERWIRATGVGDSLLSDSTRYKGSVIWLTREDLPGVDDTVMIRIVPFDAKVFKIPTLGTPRLSICIKTESLTPMSTSEHSTLK